MLAIIYLEKMEKSLCCSICSATFKGKRAYRDIRRHHATYHKIKKVEGNDAFDAPKFLNEKMTHESMGEALVTKTMAPPVVMIDSVMVELPAVSI